MVHGIQMTTIVQFIKFLWYGKPRTVPIKQAVCIEKEVDMIRPEAQPIINAVAILAKKAAEFDAGLTAANDQINSLQAQLDTANATIASMKQDNLDTDAALTAATAEPNPVVPPVS